MLLNFKVGYRGTINGVQFEVVSVTKGGVNVDVNWPPGANVDFQFDRRAREIRLADPRKESKL